MRSLEPKQHRARLTPAPTTLRRSAGIAAGRQMPGFLHLQHTVGNQGLQRLINVVVRQHALSPLVYDVLRSPGQPLDPTTRALMESRFGQDFSRVRVHTDSRAAESARALNALAYTVGRDVVFDSGQYAPGTHEGRGVLAHELTHVVQQGMQKFGPGGSLKVVEPNDASERHAEAVASSLMTGSGDVRPLPLAIQRQPRTTSEAPCPGTHENRKILPTNEFTTQFGVGHPKNVHDTNLGIMCYDEDDKKIEGSWVQLGPGDSIDHYAAKPHTATIAFFCESSGGVARLEYDLPIW